MLPKRFLYLTAAQRATRSAQRRALGKENSAARSATPSSSGANADTGVIVRGSATESQRSDRMAKARALRDRNRASTPPPTQVSAAPLASSSPATGQSFPAPTNPLRSDVADFLAVAFTNQGPLSRAGQDFKATANSGTRGAGVATALIDELNRRGAPLGSMEMQALLRQHGQGFNRGVGTEEQRREFLNKLTGGGAAPATTGAVDDPSTPENEALMADQDIKSNQQIDKLMKLKQSALEQGDQARADSIQSRIDRMMTNLPNLPTPEAPTLASSSPATGKSFSLEETLTPGSGAIKPRSTRFLSQGDFPDPGLTVPSAPGGLEQTMERLTKLKDRKPNSPGVDRMLERVKERMGLLASGGTSGGTGTSGSTGGTGGTSEDQPKSDSILPSSPSDEDSAQLASELAFKDIEKRILDAMQISDRELQIQKEIDDLYAGLDLGFQNIDEKRLTQRLAVGERAALEKQVLAKIDAKQRELQRFQSGRMGKLSMLEKELGFRNSELTRDFQREQLGFQEEKFEFDKENQLFQNALASAKSGLLYDPETNTFSQIEGTSSLSQKERADLEKGLNDRFVKQSAEYVTIRDSFARVQASAIDPSGAGDLALIFNYMKILDPSSVVRESEFATAQNSASVPERIRGLYNQVLQGTRLSDAQRDDFVDRAGRLFDTQDVLHNQRKDEFTRLAGLQGVRPEAVIQELGLPSGLDTFTPSGAQINLVPSDTGILDGAALSAIDRELLAGTTPIGDIISLASELGITQDQIIGRWNELNADQQTLSAYRKQLGL